MIVTFSRAFNHITQSSLVAAAMEMLSRAPSSCYDFIHLTFQA